MLRGGEVVVCNRPQVPLRNWRLKATWVSMSLCFLVPTPGGQAGATLSTESLCKRFTSDLGDCPRYPLQSQVAKNQDSRVICQLHNFLAV